MMVINACFFHKLYSPPGPLRHKADLGEKKERKKLFSHQRDVESSDVADRISHEARGGAVAGVGARTRRGEQVGCCGQDFENGLLFPTFGCPG